MSSSIVCRIVVVSLVAWGLAASSSYNAMRAEQIVLSDGVSGDGHMTVRTDQYGAFGTFSVTDPGFGRFDPDGPVGLRDWQFWSGLMLADGEIFQWLMDEDDWPGDFGTRLPDANVISDTASDSQRTSSFALPEYGGLEVDLVQETPASGYNFVQTYTFNNRGSQPLSLKLVWMDDQDVEFAQTWQENLVGFVPGDEPRVYFIEDSDVSGTGDPGIADRDRRISIAARTSGDIAFDGFLVGRTPLGQGGATHLHFYIQDNHSIEDDFLNTIQEITRGSGIPAGTLDDDSDNLLDDPGDTSAAMQFSLDLATGGSATLALDYIGGSLRNSVFAGAPVLQAGDADMDLDFDQVDLVRVQVAAKYLSGQPATWGEGDWDRAPGGEVGAPPQGNGSFDQVDIIAALGAGFYLAGPYAAVRPGGVAGDGQTSVGYNPSTGEMFIDAPANTELTSVNISSAAGIISNPTCGNLGGTFDNCSSDNIFKATFGSSFGSLSFGNVAQTRLSEEFVANDLSVIGSLAGGGDLGNVDLIYLPEPDSFLLAMLAAFCGLFVLMKNPWLFGCLHSIHLRAHTCLPCLKTPTNGEESSASNQLPTAILVRSRTGPNIANG